MTPLPIDRMPEGFDAIQRRVLLCGMIDRNSASQVLMQLLYLRHISCEKTMTLVINSTGGMVDASLMLYDFIADERNRIATHCCGIAEGTAVLLLASGMQGSRTAVRQAGITLAAAFDTCRSGDVDEVMRTDYVLAKLLAQRMGATAAELVTLMHLRKIFSAEEATKLGLIDRIVDSETKV
jgi:ATP-dependent Clp protease protease subunit